MIRVMAVYPNHPGSRFDIDYYTTRHAPFARALMEPLGLAELRIVGGEAGLDGGPPPFWAVSEMVFADRAAFDAIIAECGAELFADTANYTDVEPILQIGSVATQPHSSES